MRGRSEKESREGILIQIFRIVPDHEAIYSAHMIKEKEIKSLLKKGLRGNVGSTWCDECGDECGHGDLRWGMA